MFDRRYFLSCIGTRPGHVDPPPIDPGDSCVSSITDYYANPLALDDAFHRPIGDAAQYAADNHAETVAWLKYSSANLNQAPGAGWSAVWSDGDPAVLPLHTVTQRAGSNQTFSVPCRFPANWDTGLEKSGGYLTDRSAVIYERPSATYPFGRWHEFWQLDNLAGPDTWQAMNYYVRAGNALGHTPSPRGACASGISLILGMFRGSEWNTADAVCEHALAIACPSKKSQGTYQILGPGIVWPATSRDNSGANNLGPCPYGRLLGIPPQSRGGPDPNTLGLGAAGSIAWRLYWVFVKRGVYIVDQSGGNSFRADQYLTTAAANAIRSAIGILYKRLRPILNVSSSQAALGGGNPLAPNCAFNRTTTTTIAIKSSAYWESQGAAIMAADQSTAGPLSTSADSNNHYTLAYYQNGHVAMYRATGLTKYLDRALLYINNVIAAATTQAGGYLGWKSSVDGNAEASLREVYFWRYACMTLDAMANAGALTGSYLTQYNTILAFIERNIWTKWYNRGVTANIYRSVVHICAHWAIISDFLARRSANTAIVSQAVAIRDAIDHGGMPNWNGDSIRSMIGAHPNDALACFWHAYFPKVAGGGTAPGIPADDTSYGSDTAHGGDVLAWIVEAHDRGSTYWKDADISKLIRLFGTIIWPSGTTYYKYLIGSSMNTMMDGNFNQGFRKLGRYDRALQVRLEGQLVAPNIGLYGNMALNAKILGA